MSIQAPYRFVPLSQLVVLPEWGNQVSHDKPFKDGICGELDILLTTQSDICVGGEQVPSTQHQAGIVKFFTTPDGKPAIPASSLKGMLRNVLEIATFSRFKQVEDQKLGVRDIRQAGNFYHTAIKNPEAGWLVFEDDKWVIYPCDFARIHQKDIISTLKISYSTWTSYDSVKGRYEVMGQVCPPISFEFDRKNSIGQDIVRVANKGIQGNIVVTGQPGTKFYDERNPKQPRGAKKYEFVFFDYEDEVDSLEIDPKVFQGFQQIYADTPAWQFWRQHLSKKSSNKVPVFFHTDKDDDSVVISLGLTMMYKLPYKHSIHDAVANTNDVHLSLSDYDFSDLLFGTIDDNDEQSGKPLRGRVNIGLAFLNSRNVKLSVSSPMVLSSPKPTYYPMYIKQDSKFNFKQLMKDDVQLSGWKRYPLKTSKILPPPKDVSKSVQVILELIPKDTQFVAKIRFHNLRPIELGALLWVLDFGGREKLRHAIGIGKPYGLGQVTLRVAGQKIRPNNVNSQEVELTDCKKLFIDYMTEKLSQDFESHESIHTLMAYAIPNAIRDLDYMLLAEFAGYRHNDYVSTFKQKFSSTQTNITIPSDSVSDVKIELAKTVTSNSKNEISDNLAKLSESLAKDVLAFLQTNRSEMTPEMYLLVEIEKQNTKFAEHRSSIANYLKLQYQSEGKWREISSANKQERKNYDQTMRIKRFL